MRKLLVTAVIFLAITACNKNECTCNLMQKVDGLDSLLIKETVVEKNTDCTQLRSNLLNQEMQNDSTAIVMCEEQRRSIEFQSRF